MSKIVKSRILLSEEAENTYRRTSSARVYYPAMIQIANEEKPALFTLKQIQDAINRAELQPDDAPLSDTRPFWVKVLAYIAP